RLGAVGVAATAQQQDRADDDRQQRAEEVALVRGRRRQDRSDGRGEPAADDQAGHVLVRETAALLDDVVVGEVRVLAQIVGVGGHVRQRQVRELDGQSRQDRNARETDGRGHRGDSGGRRRRRNQGRDQERDG